MYSLLWLAACDEDPVSVAHPTIDAWYQGVGDPDGVISRDLFEAVARDTICAFELGGPCDESAFCGLSAVPCANGDLCDASGRCMPP